MRSHAGIGLLCIALIGCGTSRTVLRSDRRFARIDVSSAPAGAMVYVNRTPRGNTPVAVEVPYTQTETQVRPGSYRTGWLLLVTGLLGLAGSAAATYWGIDQLGKPASSDAFDTTSATVGTLAATLGITAGLYGLFGVIGGGYMVASTKSSFTQVETEPKALVIGLNLPGYGLREARLAPVNPDDKTPDFDRAKKLHFASGVWSAPGLPPNLLLADASTGKETIRKPVEPAPRRPAPVPAVRRKAIIVVFNIEDRGANITQAMLARLSDYLAMKIAATGHLRVVPRDRLRKRLVAQKKASYKQCFDQSCQIEIGRELAAQHSLSTMIVRLGKKCVVTGVLYDLRKATSEGGASYSGGCGEDQIVTTLERVAEKVAVSAR